MRRAQVKRSQLALLEHMMKACPREDIAIMARRRSGNMGSAPSSDNPFSRADTFIKHRREAQAEVSDKNLIMNAQNALLAGAISRAYIQLPPEIQDRGWSEWREQTLSAVHVNGDIHYLSY
jgi:hypothetical protein